LTHRGRVFTSTFRVHWVDTDAAGVMHFSNYFRYFEACEQEFYHSLGIPPSELRQEHNILLPRVEARCEYKAPCRFDDQIEVALRVHEVTSKTITLNFELRRIGDGKLAAEGRVKCIAVNQEWKVVELPALLERILRENME